MSSSPRQVSSGALGWLITPVIATLAIGAAVLGCKKDPAPAPSNEPVAAMAETARPEAASARFDEEAFTLMISPKGEYVVGKPAAFEVQLAAKAGFKCNDQYPYKFKAKASPGISYSADVIGKDGMHLQGKDKGVMTVGFTPAEPGRKVVAGQFAFSVCTEEQCLVERRDLELAIDVR